MPTTEDKAILYERIERLVEKFQAGSSEAGLEILQLFGFHPEAEQLSAYLKKYFNLLRYGVINFRDRDTRGFIRLFISDTDINRALKPSYQYADTKKAARKTVQMINDRLSYLNDTELIHDLCLILLHLAKRYQKKGRKKNFCGYLYTSYRFYLYHHFRYLFKDLSHSPFIEPLKDVIDENSEIRLEDKWYLDLYFEKESQELGINWIMGKTASFPFNQLTPFERTILSLHDDKRMTYEEVGYQMGYHRDTIWSKRKQIKEKLEEMMKTLPND